MLFLCPQCGAGIRLAGQIEQAGRYLCPSCHEIVRPTLARKEGREKEGRDKGEPVDPSPGPAGESRGLPARAKILVADDSVLVQGLARQILADAGYDVTVCSDGVEALRAAEKDPPDLAVLDLLMPRMTGFDVLREMKRMPRLQDVPVLMLSGVYKENVVGFLHQLGAAGFMDKQTLAETLLFRVRAILQRTTA